MGPRHLPRTRCGPEETLGGGGGLLWEQGKGEPVLGSWRGSLIPEQLQIGSLVRPAPCQRCLRRAGSSRDY